jgi:hypothetical protein
MSESKTSKNSRVIVLDNDKLDYIEHLIVNNREMETLISNLIDYTIEHKFSEADKCRGLIKEKQPDKYEKIVYATNSIIYNYDLVIG